MINKKVLNMRTFLFFWNNEHSSIFSQKKSDFFALFKIFNILKVGLYIYDPDHDITNSKYPKGDTANRSRDDLTFRSYFSK